MVCRKTSHLRFTKFTNIQFTEDNKELKLINELS